MAGLYRGAGVARCTPLRARVNSTRPPPPVRATAMPHAHAFGAFHPTRRAVLQSALAGVGGLTFPNLLRARDSGRAGGAKSVILLWMAGGPSQIDTLDPKPDRPPENRGPFGTTQTRLPGVLVCEHLPKLAAALD